MKKQKGYIYRNIDTGEHFKSEEKDGQLVLSNPSYPFVFLFDVQEPLELVGRAEKYEHLLEKVESQFYEGDSLNVEIDKNGEIQVKE